MVEQWLPNKPAPKRITYRSINQNELIENETKRKRNRYIEYKKPHTTIEVEIIRLPIIRQDPKDYHHQQTNDPKQLKYFRTLSQDLELFRWRI